MRKLLPAALMMAVAGVASAQMPTPDQVMQENDKNKDGIITKEEASGSQLGEFFDMIDADHDGKITRAEIETALSGFGGGGPPPGAPPAAAAPPAATPAPAAPPAATPTR